MSMRVFYEIRCDLDSKQWLLVRYLADASVGYAFGRLLDENVIAVFRSRADCIDYLLSLSDFDEKKRLFLTNLE